MDSLEIAAERLQREVEVVYRARLMLQESPAEFAERLGRETEVRSTVDESCRRWIQHLTWPKLSPELALFAWDRVAHAHFVIGWLKLHGFRQVGLSVEQFLELLLVKSWPEFGIQRLRFRADSQ